jgi:hypothetical protein
MDAEGGEKLELLTELFRLLVLDAERRNLLRDDFYYLSDQLLSKFKMLQGFDPETPFLGNRVQQAFMIWRQCPRQVRDGILRANGFSIPENFVMTGAITVFLD